MCGAKNVMVSKMSCRIIIFYYYLNFNQSIKCNHIHVLYVIIAWHPQLLDAYYCITYFSSL